MFQGHDLNGSIEYQRYRERLRKEGRRYPPDMEEEDMSNALWCDIDDPETNAIPGRPGHSFSAKDPEMQHFERTAPITVETGNSYGQPVFQTQERVTQTLDMCGYHSDKLNPFGAKSPSKVEALEAKNADWQAGFEAAEEHYKYGASK